MATRKASRASTTEGGVALIEQVIAHVERRGMAVLDVPGLAAPKPLPLDALAKLRFPGRMKLSPSLTRWLAFDVAWVTELGWLDKGKLSGKTIGRFAVEHYGSGADGDDAFGHFRGDFDGGLYLLPGGADSRRALYVGLPDSLGEHPVLLTDNDDVPSVELLFPGFDVFMADLVGLDLGAGPIEKHPLFKKRFAEHRARNFSGRSRHEAGDANGDPPAPKPYAEGDPIPLGFRVATDPFTRKRCLVPI